MALDRPATAPATPPLTAWQRAVAERARTASAAAGGGHLCMRTHQDALAIWDLTRDERLFEGRIIGLRDVVAFPGGCLALAGTEARAYDLRGGVRRLAGDAVAVAWDRDQILVVGGGKAQMFTAEAAPRSSFPAGVGVSAVRRIGGYLALGHRDGSIELQPLAPGGAAAPSLEGRMATAVVQLREGPRGTLVAGYANGNVAIWSLESGVRLDTLKLHGAAVHLAVDRGRLYAASALGDGVALDLSVFRRDYCDLLDDVWRRVPVVWQGGRPVLREAPPQHRCRNPKIRVDNTDNPLAR
jgi:hypothetical protein